MLKLEDTVKSVLFNKHAYLQGDSTIITPACNTFSNITFLHQQQRKKKHRSSCCCTSAQWRLIHAYKTISCRFWSLGPHCHICSYSLSCSDISLSCDFAVIHYKTAMICKGPNTHFIKPFSHLLGTKKVLYVNGNSQWCPEYPVIFSNPSFWCSQFPIYHLKLTTNNLILYDAAE